MEEERSGAIHPEARQEFTVPGLAPREGKGKALARRIARRHPTMIVGMVIIVLMGLIAIFAPFLFTEDPTGGRAKNRLQPPSSEHWFGTDFVGRDVWSRTLYGARISLLVGVSVGLLASAVATIVGLFAGYFRTFDMVVMRVMDGIMAIPGVLLAIALVSITGASLQNVIFALTFVEGPHSVRIVRSAVLSLREEEYVDAARAIGAGTPRILLQHITPGIVAPLIVIATIIGAGAILAEATLSFLGAGTPPEIPAWGNMMAEGRRALSLAIWAVAFPGAFLTLTVLGVNVVGDNLRDMLDPKLSRSA